MIPLISLWHPISQFTWSKLCSLQTCPVLFLLCKFAHIDLSFISFYHSYLLKSFPSLKVQLKWFVFQSRYSDFIWISSYSFFKVQTVVSQKRCSVDNRINMFKWIYILERCDCFKARVGISILCVSLTGARGTQMFGQTLSWIYACEGVFVWDKHVTQ